MFEDLIMQLEELGVEYIEDYDAGTLTIPVEDIDKVDLIEIINAVNNSGLLFTIDEISLIVQGGDASYEEEEELASPETDYMDAAMADALNL
jgi:hypothetical protein